MAKARKKTRKVAKRPATKRKAVTKVKARRPAKTKARKAKARKTKPRKQNSIIDTMADTVLETGALRRRLAGPNTFED